MANVEYVAVEEMLAKRSTRQSVRKQVQAEYEGYLKGLVPGQAGKVTPDKGEKPSLVRDRLRSAAKRLSTPIQLRRRSGAIYFKLKDAPDKVGDTADTQAVIEAEPPAVVVRTRRRAVAAAESATAAATAGEPETAKRGRGRRPSA